MEKKGNLISHTLWLGASGALSKAAVFFLMPVYTAFLTPAEYGTAEILVSTAVLLIPAVSLCVPEAVFRFAAGGESQRAVFACGVRLMLAGALVFIAFLPFFRFSRVIAPRLYLLVAYVFCSLFHSFPAHLLRARGQYAWYAVQQLACTLVTVLLELLFLVVWHAGVSGYLSAIFLADALTGAVLFCFLRPAKLSGNGKANGKLTRAMLAYSLPLIPTSALWWVVAASDRYIVLRYAGEAQTGLYAAAGRIPSLLTFASGLFLEAWHYAALRVGNEERVALFRRIFSVFLALLVTATAMLTLTSKYTVARLFSPAFGGAARFLPLLLIAALFSACSSFLGSLYAVRLRTFYSMLTAAVGAALNVALNFLWIPRLGGVGAALATAISYLGVFLFRAFDCRAVIPPRRYAAKLALSAGFLGIAAWQGIAGFPFFFSVAALLSPLPFLPDLSEALSLLRKKIRFFRQKTTEKQNNP